MIWTWDCGGHRVECGNLNEKDSWAFEYLVPNSWYSSARFRAYDFAGGSFKNLQPSPVFSVSFQFVIQDVNLQLLVKLPYLPDAMLLCNDGDSHILLEPLTQNTSFHLQTGLIMVVYHNSSKVTNTTSLAIM